MGSSNGVYVLGQKVDDAIIREGDVFSMGDVFVRILPDDMPETLALPNSKSDATLLQMSASSESAKWLREPSLPPQAISRPRANAGPPPLLAPRVLGVVSLAVGAALIVGPVSLGPQLGVMAYVLPVIGVSSAAAGLALLSGLPWARNLHYALFTVWTLTCLLAPFGVIGFSYQLRGEDRPETDPFFAIVLGIVGAMAVVALVLAAFLARIYVPAPLPL